MSSEQIAVGTPVSYASIDPLTMPRAYRCNFFGISFLIAFTAISVFVNVVGIVTVINDRYLGLGLLIGQCAVSSIVNSLMVFSLARQRKFKAGVCMMV